MQKLKLFLRAFEHPDKDNNFKEWSTYTDPDYPQQGNTWDCGVFMCQTIEFLSRGERTFRFSQRNMPYFRKRMLLEIARGALEDSLE